LAREKSKTTGRHFRPEAGHKIVERLPPCPRRYQTYWIESQNAGPRLTNYLFKFPAKFHPPVVRWALGKYGRRGSPVLDPFTGSGTTQVEAMARGIPSVGVDIDPVACLMARAKTTPLDPGVLEDALLEMRRQLDAPRRAREILEAQPAADISDRRFALESVGLSIPSIPNMFHWFRRYVVIDLARILTTLDWLGPDGAVRSFFRACLGSVIRQVSNADPAPVSGVEVTRIQAEKNETRCIAVYKTFLAKCEQAIGDMKGLTDSLRCIDEQPEAHVIQGDTLSLIDTLRSHGLPESDYPLVITSPPYCRAVEYSRRHRLEMYWLGLIDSQVAHIRLKHRYLGRCLVRQGDWDESAPFRITEMNGSIKRIEGLAPEKGRTVRHYFSQIDSFLKCLPAVLKRNGTAVVVVGDSVCEGVRIPTSKYIRSLARRYFRINNTFSYALRNHYMQYGLRNGEGIKEETVIVLKPW